MVSIGQYWSALVSTVCRETTIIIRAHVPLLPLFLAAFFVGRGRDTAAAAVVVVA